MILDILMMILLPCIVAVATWMEMKRNHDFRREMIMQVIEFSDAQRQRFRLQDEFYKARSDLHEAQIKGLELKIQRLTLRITGDSTRDL